MKKALSILIFAILLAGPLMSQKQLYFGLGGTFLSSAIINQNNYGLSEMDYKITTGGSGNVNFGFDFSKHAGLKLEIGYTKLGQKYSDTNMDTALVTSTYARNVSLNYLQIPLLFKYRTGGEVARFYFMVGPQFNLLLSATQTYTKNGLPFSFEKTNLANLKFDVGKESIKERYSSLDIMARLDFGVDITLVKNLILNIGLTMGYGLMDINSTDWRMKDNSGNYNASHNVYGGLNLGINYCLPVGAK